MKRKEAVGAIGAAAAAVVVGGPWSALARAARAGTNAEAVHAAIARVVPRYAEQITLRLMQGSAEDADAFSISGTRGAIVLSGTSASALFSAFNWYLKYVANGQLTWAGEHLDLGSVLPAPARVITRSTPYRYRYIFNQNVFGYTVPYWSWERWERELDVLAVNGFNTMLQQIGQEVLWLDTLREFGYSDDEALAWIAPPAHQNWQWLANMHGPFGTVRVTRDLIERRAALGRRIADRMRELGIAPVFPGFGGYVPSDFAKRNPGARVIAQGQWLSFERPSWLDPTTDVFAKMAMSFYRHQAERFGLPNAYNVDVLHEGGIAAGVDLGEAGAAIQRAMLAANPSALWLLLAWQENPRRAVVERLDRTKVLVIDAIAENRPQWMTKDGFWGCPWTWGYINNFGGNDIVAGRLYALATILPGTQRMTRDQRGNLSGVHIFSEGIDHNPVMFDLLTDMVWRGDPVDLDEWLRDFARRRYGHDDAHAVEAWRVFARTAYGAPPRVEDGGQQSLFNAQPSLDTSGANPFVPGDWLYDPVLFERGWRALANASPQLGTSDSYRFDCCDMTRQVLVNRGRLLYERLVRAYNARDRIALRTTSREFLRRMDQLDALLATRREFLLGTWIDQARAWGRTPAEADGYEFDARTLVTTWAATRDSYNGLHDYANKDWAGLVRDFYKPRWRLFFTTLDRALQSGVAPAPVDWFARDYAWTLQTRAYPTAPSGDTLARMHAIARTLTPLRNHGDNFSVADR